MDGAAVGEHRGAAAYTVGQRQGLGVALGEPRYVSRIDPLTNTIQLGRREDLETRTFTIERASFVAPAAPPRRSAPRSASAIARRRSRRRSSRSAGGAGRDRTDEPVWAAAPGQAAVLYDGDEVLGGGRIERPAPRAERCAGRRRRPRVAGA